MSFLKEKNETCEITHLKPSFIQSGNCISKKILPREICSGKCDSEESSYFRINNMILSNKKCKCCKAEKTYIEDIEIICDNEVFKAEYIRIAECKCRDCESNT